MPYLISIMAVLTFGLRCKLLYLWEMGTLPCLLHNILYMNSVFLRIQYILQNEWLEVYNLHESDHLCYFKLWTFSDGVNNQQYNPYQGQRSNESFDLLLREAQAKLRKRSSVWPRLGALVITIDRSVPALAA